MAFQLLTCRKRILAFTADEWFLTQMNPPQMNINIPFTQKCFAANIARMHRSLIAMDHHVSMRMCLIEERLHTIRTYERFLTTVYQHMPGQLAFHAECFPAQLAREWSFSVFTSMNSHMSPQNTFR